MTERQSKVRMRQAVIPGFAYSPAGRKLDVEVFPFSDIRRRSLASTVRATHRYDFHLLLLVTEGSPKQIVDFEPVQCSPGSLLALRPGQVHSFGEALDWEGWLILFRAEFLPSGADDHAELLPERMLESMPQHRVLTDLRYRATAEAIAILAADTQAALENRAALHALLRYQLCTLILRLRLFDADQRSEARPLTSTQRRFESFKALLEANYAGWHLIGSYTDALGCTQKSLNRATQEAAGLNAKGMIDRRLTLEAKRLLVHTDRPIYVIAEGLGFDEPTNFSKFFRKHASQSPARFRVAYRA